MRRTDPRFRNRPPSASHPHSLLYCWEAELFLIGLLLAPGSQVNARDPSPFSRVVGLFLFPEVVLKFCRGPSTFRSPFCLRRSPSTLAADILRASYLVLGRRESFVIGAPTGALRLDRCTRLCRAVHFRLPVKGPRLRWLFPLLVSLTSLFPRDHLYRFR